MIKEFILEVFSCLSRLVNVLTGGTADITFSARSYRDDLWTAHVIDWVALKVFGEEEHCRKWWQAEIDRSYLNISLAEARKQVT
jgi:hypothetical protein